jgi:hypothetical protein
MVVAKAAFSPGREARDSEVRAKLDLQSEWSNADFDLRDRVNDDLMLLNFSMTELMRDMAGGDSIAPPWSIDMDARFESKDIRARYARFESKDIRARYALAAICSQVSRFSV